MIKIYWDTTNSCPEIVCPDGTSYWSWYDQVSKKCGWYKTKPDQLAIKDDPERFEYMGEL